MSLYERHLLPHVIHFCCGMKPIMRQRDKVVPLASGRVLEIGFGSGLNLAHYQQHQVSKLWALEPASGMQGRASRQLQLTALDAQLLQAGAEAIPLDNDCVDDIVLTYSLCTIPDPQSALGEMRRVLRPGGRLLFSEHGLAPDTSTRRWQRRLGPAWRKFGGGCNLDRDIPGLIVEAGFQCEKLNAMYIPGFKPASYHYWGIAQAS